MDSINLTTKQITTAGRVAEVIEYIDLQDEYATGFHPLKLYCASTGRCIGDLNSEAIYMQLLTIPENTPISAVVEAMIEMNLIAAKPSPAWVYQTTPALKELIKHDYVGACVFFLTRAYQQGNKSLMAKNGHGRRLPHKFKSYADHIEWNRVRINLFAHLSKNFSRRYLESLSHLLLEVDAKAGLMSCKFPDESLWELVDNKNLSCLFRHYKKILRTWSEKEVSIKQSGHSQSRAVYQHYDGVNRTTTKKQIKEREKQRKTSKLDKLFYELRTQDTPAPIVDKTVKPFVATKGFKFKRKEV